MISHPLSEIIALRDQSSIIFVHCIPLDEMIYLTIATPALLTKAVMQYVDQQHLTGYFHMFPKIEYEQN